MKSKLIFLIFLIHNFYIESFCEDIIDLSCAKDPDCLQLQSTDYNVKCLNSKCVCEANGKEVGCRPSVVVLSNLIRNNCPCNMANSICDEKRNICLCKNEFTASADRKRCIKKLVKIGEQCESNEQCAHSDPFTECKDQLKVCVCMEHFTNYHGKCYSLVGNLEKCASNFECHRIAPNSTCGEGQCICEENFVTNRNKTLCLKASNYNETCTETNQCKATLGSGSECENGSCNCKSVYYLNSKQDHNHCEKSIYIGDYCSDDQDCHMDGVDEQTMFCKAGECHCHDHSQVNGTICVSSGNSASPFLLLSILSCFLIVLDG